MIRVVFYIMSVVLTVPVFGQNDTLLLQYKVHVLGHEKAAAELAEHIHTLKRSQSRTKNDVQFIGSVFQKTQSRFFQHYTQYAQFHELFESGTYNCLTGTIIYAIIFQHLGYNVQMFETRYHSFLIVSLGNNQVLVESTDALNGVVVGKNNVDHQVKGYLDKEASAPEDPSAMSLKDYAPIQSVTLTQLIGLHYLNTAVVNINAGDFKRAIKDLGQARTLYPESGRIRDLLNTASSQCDMAPLSGSAIATDNLNNN